MMNLSEEQQQLRIDELLDLIRREARYLEQEENLLLSAEKTPLPLLELPAWEEDIEAFPMKAEYHVNEFLVYDDIEFVANALRGILQREPDESGLDSYTLQLRRHGESSKLEVLTDLMASAEGKAHKVRVLGIRWMAFEFRNQHKWWFHRRSFLTVYKILKSRLSNDQARYSLLNDIRFRRHHQRVNCYLAGQHQLFDFMRQRERQLEGEQEALNSKLERYRRDMLMARGDLLAQQRRVNVLLDKLQTPAGDENPAQVELATHANDKLDAFYLAFENECRGDEAEIREQLGFYLPRVTANRAVTDATPLLDIGSGRGEWLALLRDEAIPARGVDISRVLVEHCRQQALQVELADAIDYLRRQTAGSIGMVTSFHLIEHLPFDRLFALVEECWRVLVPGGAVIFETPNPENLMVGSHTFYHDPTHRNPVTPTLIEFLLRHLGFVDLELPRLHPYPSAARLKGMDPLTERVNGAFCGAQDFAVIGIKPA